MKIEKIIYDTTRGIYSVEDKLSIATIFIFCWKLSSKYFAELLYTDNSYQVKLIDWGLGSKSVKELIRKCGTPEYCAPEVIKGSYGL